MSIICHTLPMAIVTIRIHFVAHSLPPSLLIPRLSLSFLAHPVTSSYARLLTQRLFDLASSVHTNNHYNVLAGAPSGSRAPKLFV